MTTPRLGIPELAEGQAVPETSVNEQVRYLEQGAGFFTIVDRDLSTPPGSPVDGDAYIVAGTGLAAWASHDGDIAFRFSSAWEFINIAEGMAFWIEDENKLLVALTASTFQEFVATTEASNAEVWAGSASNRFLSPLRLYSASAPVALTSGATITPDGDNGFNFTLTIAHNATLADPSNFDVGRSGLIVITQDGTGTRTLAYGSNWKFPGGAPVLSTAIGAVDVLAYYVVTASLIVATLTKAYTS